MDTEAFVRWALDDARTVEERYTTELLVEHGLDWWYSRRNIFNRDPIDVRLARNRERQLNPAYEPHYSEDDLRKTAEIASQMKSWSPHSDRPVRDIAVVAFMDCLEEFTLQVCCFVTDISPLTRLPCLRKLQLGSPGYEFRRFECRDFTPLARCSALRDLALGFDAHWPDFTGLDSLTQLDQLTLSGNLLALPRGISFPNVRQGALYCQPLAARNVAEMPQLPSCEFFTLSGAERLDGIERMPLRNLTLIGPFAGFEPLVALKNLTCLTVTPRNHLDPAHMPRDVSALARLPALRCIEFGHRACSIDLPRDYAPLTDAPALRELIVHNCAPVEVELAAINAALPPCDDLYAPREPQPLPPLRMFIGPHSKLPRRVEEHRDPDEAGRLIDMGLRAHEGRWVGGFLRRLISSRIGHRDWGEALANGVSRMLHVTIHSFECVGKLPLILDATREAMIRLRDGYGWAEIGIHLRVPPPEDTPAQKELEEKFQADQERWESEQHERDRQEYIERLHQLELKQQEGAEIIPEEFSPSEQDPYPIPPWQMESPDDDDAGDDADAGDIATKEKPMPPARFMEDDHPLAENYRLYAVLTLEEVWFLPHHRTLAVQLMRREPDEEYPDEKEGG